MKGLGARPSLGPGSGGVSLPADEERDIDARQAEVDTAQALLDRRRKALRRKRNGFTQMVEGWRTLDVEVISVQSEPQVRSLWRSESSRSWPIPLAPGRPPHGLPDPENRTLG